MLNPQRTLERGYAVILNNQKQAARHPKQLNTDTSFEIRLAEGQVQVQFSEVLLGS
jgi:exodeoxyribonuclease VII large subunit